LASPFDCILGKPVPQRLKNKLTEADDRLRQQYPDMDDSARATHLFDMMQEQLSANERNLFRMSEVQNRINSTIEGRAPREQIRILMNTIEGAEDRRFAFMLSVAGTRSAERAIMDGFVADMYKEFTRRLATPGLTRNKGLQRNIVRESFGEDTGDATAKAMLGGLRKMEEYNVNSMRAEGARVHYDPNRQFIVQHSAAAVRRVSQSEWVDDILPRLDLERMVDRETGLPFTPETIRPVLDDLYHTIRTNGAHDLQPGVRKWLPAWQRVDQTRFFIWKDFDAWEGYNNQFGFGDDYFGAVVRYIDRMSRDVALFKTLGPDWDATGVYMRDLMQKAAAEHSPTTARHNVAQFQNALDIATGKMGQPHNQWLAQAGSSARNVFQSALLGQTAILQALGDSWLQTMARQFNGLSVSRQIPQFTRNLLDFARKGPKAAAADLALRIGVPIQSIQHSILGSMRAIGEFDGAKWSHLMADTNFRLGGMTLITDAQQAAFGTEFVINLTENLGRRYANFRDPQLGRAMELYGISEADWLRVSQVAPTFDNQGVRYLDLLTLMREVDYDVGARIHQMITTEMNARAVLTRTPAASRRLTFGRSPGSVEGEMARVGTNLLSWPITFLWTQIGARFMEPNISGGRKALQMANLFIGMTVMGAFATYIRDIAAGRDPQTIENIDFWRRSAALGGGLGIMADWLFREHYGEWDLLSKMIGPGFGIAAHALSIPIRGAQSAVVDDDYNVGRDVVRLLRQATPFSTLWYARAAIDRLIFDQLQDMVDPNARESFRSRRRNYARNKDQTFWWAPGETSPERAPDFGRIFE
jgi:hypothetical protein